MNMFRNKRGEVSTSMSIYIALGILVVIIAIIGITDIGGIRSKLMGGVGLNSNVDQIALSCNQACSTAQVDSCCGNPRVANFADKRVIRGNCESLASSISGINSFAIDCDGDILIKCSVDSLEAKANITVTSATWNATCSSGLKDYTVKIQDSEGQDVSKQKCCVKLI